MLPHLRPYEPVIEVKTGECNFLHRHTSPNSAWTSRSHDERIHELSDYLVRHAGRRRSEELLRHVSRRVGSPAPGLTAGPLKGTAVENSTTEMAGQHRGRMARGIGERFTSRARAVDSLSGKRAA